MTNAKLDKYFVPHGVRRRIKMSLNNYAKMRGFTKTEMWKKLIKEMKSGDVLEEYSTDQASWKSLGGREGIDIIRNGKIVGGCFTRMN